MDLYKITEKKLNYFRYSKNTANIYLHYINEFQRAVNKHSSRISAKDIQNYIDSYSFKSGSQQNQIISALKFMWEKALGKKYLKIDFRRPRKEKRLPRVIDSDKIIKAINSIENKKHKAIIQLAYGTGMRVSEVINLKIKDVDSERMMIHIKNAKGRKDRVVPFSEETLLVLRDYVKEYRPKEYLFNGQSSLRYSRTSCNNIVKKFLGKDSHFHLIRHSYATKLVEGGVNTMVLQRLMGHNSPKTCEVYTHVSNNALQGIRLPC